MNTQPSTPPELLPLIKRAHTVIDKLMGDSDLDSDESEEMKVCQELSLAIVSLEGSHTPTPPLPDDLAKAIEDNLLKDGHGKPLAGVDCVLASFARSLAKRSQELQEQLADMTKARDLYKEDLRKTIEYYEQQRSAK